MTDPFLLLTPALVGGVLALVRFVGCDRVLGLTPVTPLPPPPSQIVDFAVDPNNPPPLRNNFEGWVGMVIQPMADQSLIGLGRWCAPTNNQAHQVKVVDATTGLDIPQAIVTVSLANEPVNTFVFVQLQSPVTLSAGKAYFLLSEEHVGGDGFIDYNIIVTPSADFSVPSAVYGNPTGTPPDPYTTYGMANNCYGPVNAQY